MIWSYLFGVWYLYSTEKWGDWQQKKLPSLGFLRYTVTRSAEGKGNAVYTRKRDVIKVPMIAASAVGATLLLCGGAGSYHIIDHLLSPSSASETVTGGSESPVPSDGGGSSSKPTAKPTVQASNGAGDAPQASDGGGAEATQTPTSESKSTEEASPQAAPSENPPSKSPSPGTGESAEEETSHDEGFDGRFDGPLKPSANDKIIIVTDTDTLSGISEREGVSVQHLAEINHIENVDLIYTGQSLRIPQFD